MARQVLGEFYHLNGGMDDKSDPIEIPEWMFRDLENFIVQRNSIHTRNGYKKEFSAALNSGEEIQRVYQHSKISDQTLLDIYIAGGKIYSGTPGTSFADITNSLSIVNNRDVKPVLITWDGKLLGTDNLNLPFIFTDPSSTSNGIVLNTSQGAPQKAATGVAYKEHIIWFNLTDHAGNVRPFSCVFSEPFDPESYGTDNHLDFGRDQAVKAALVHGDWLLVFQERATSMMWLESGSVDMPFRTVTLDNNVGCPTQDLAVNTEKGTFFIGAPNKGIYWIENGQPREPKYISKPLETFFSGVNWGRIKYGWAQELPEKNLVLFGVPHGTGQVQNNKIVALNYDQWTLDADEDPHPSYSILKGTANKPLSFNTAAKVVDANNRHRMLVGDYAGFGHKFDEGPTDDGEGITSSLDSSFYDFGTKGMEKLFLGLSIDGKMDSEKTLTVVYRTYRSATSVSQSITGGVSGSVFGTAVFGSSVFGGNPFGSIPASIKGRGRFLDYTIRTTESFELHGVTVYGDRLGPFAT